MRTVGSLSSQQTLATESASVLKYSLALARRRGHAQVTPLHVAATLLSPKSSLLKSACFKSQTPLHHYPPLQCRALEVCFSVALNRLPTSPTTLLHNQPSLSNALVAALKRAQAHQRRGCNEQQPFIAIKVELEQLILSILDDPSVNRVMREAGFSSTAIKNIIEENFSTFSSSPVFHSHYSSNGGVYSSPPSPPDHQILSNLNFLPNSFSKHKLGRTAPLLFPARAPDSEDIDLILEVLLKRKRKNIVVVGDSVASTEGLVSETMDRIVKGEVPEELKTTHFIKFQFSSVPLRYMKRDEVELNVAELKRKVDSFLALGKGVIVYTGDLKWTLDHESGSGFGYNPVDHLVANIGKLIGDYNNAELANSKGRVWLMGTANYQTYTRCQMKQPSLEVQWCLQAVSVPSSGLGLSLHATSVQDPQNTSEVVVDTKAFCSKEGNDDKLTCCDECTSHNDSTNLPSWLLQSHNTYQQKDDLVGLTRKWNRFCHSQHQTRPIQDNDNSPLFSNRNSSNDNPSSNPSWPTPTTLLDSNSITFAHSSSKPIHASSYPRYRRQQSCHIELTFNSGNHEHQSLEPNLDSLKNTEGKDEKITLALGNSLMMSNGGKLVEKKNEVLQVLKENLPWQVETVSSILEALVEESKSGNNENWLLIEGNDLVGKRRLVRGIAESVFGSTDILLHMNMKERETDRNLFSETLGNALRENENLVVLVENVDFADTRFLKFLNDRFDNGKFIEMSRKKGKSGQIIFILTRDDRTSYGDGKDLSLVIQMTLEVRENTSEFRNKRKAEWDLANKAKNPRNDQNKNASCTEITDMKKVYTRKSSSNTLDLNIKAEDEDRENEKIPEVIKNRFKMNRDSTEDGKIKDTILSKIERSFEEVCKSDGHQGWAFGVENKLLEEFLLRAGSFLNSQFKKWLKQVFETSLKTVNIGGKGGDTNVRLCLDRKEVTGLESSGYMNSCLPNTIKISFMG